MARPLRLTRSRVVRMDPFYDDHLAKMASSDRINVSTKMRHILEEAVEKDMHLNKSKKSTNEKD